MVRFIYRLGFILTLLCSNSFAVTSWIDTVAAHFLLKADTGMGLVRAKQYQILTPLHSATGSDTIFIGKNDTLKYRTKAELKTDIGAAAPNDSSFHGQWSWASGNADSLGHYLASLYLRSIPDSLGNKIFNTIKIDSLYTTGNTVIQRNGTIVINALNNYKNKRICFYDSGNITNSYINFNDSAKTMQFRMDGNTFLRYSKSPDLITFNRDFNDTGNGYFSGTLTVVGALHALSDSATIADSVRGGAQRLGGMTKEYYDTVGNGGAAVKYDSSFHSQWSWTSGNADSLGHYLASLYLRSIAGLIADSAVDAVKWAGHAWPVDSVRAAHISDSAGKIPDTITSRLGIKAPVFTGHLSGAADTVLHAPNAMLTGNGTANYVPMYTGSNTFGNSEIIDSGNGLGFGGTPTFHPLGNGYIVSHNRFYGDMYALIHNFQMGGITYGHAGNGYDCMGYNFRCDSVSANTYIKWGVDYSVMLQPAWDETNNVPCALNVRYSPYGALGSTITWANLFTIGTDGKITAQYYGAGLLRSSASGVISIDQFLSDNASWLATLNGAGVGFSVLDFAIGAGNAANRDWGINNSGAVTGALDFQVGAAAGSAPYAGSTIMRLSSTGVSFPQYTAGIMHSDASGNLTSSALTAAEIPDSLGNKKFNVMKFDSLYGTGGIYGLRNGYFGLGTASPLVNFQMHAGTNQNLLLYGYGTAGATISSINDANNSSEPMNFISSLFQFNGTLLSLAQENNTANPGSNVGDYVGDNGEWAIRTSTVHAFNLDMFNGGSAITPLTVLQNGYIGIGTATPNYLAEMYSATSTQPVLQLRDNYTTATHGGFIRLNHNNGSNTLPSGGDMLGGIAWGGYDGTTNRIGASIQGYAAETWNTSGTECPGYLAFLTCDRLTTSRTERMRIDSAGRIGIGITTPDSLFTLNGGLHGGSAYFSGKVSIGQTVADSALTVNGGICAKASLVACAGSGGPYFSVTGGGVTRIGVSGPNIPGNVLTLGLNDVIGIKDIDTVTGPFSNGHGDGLWINNFRMRKAIAVHLQDTVVYIPLIDGTISC